MILLHLNIYIYIWESLFVTKIQHSSYSFSPNRMTNRTAESAMSRSLERSEKNRSVVHFWKLFDGRFPVRQLECVVRTWLTHSSKRSIAEANNESVTNVSSLSSFFSRLKRDASKIKRQLRETAKYLNAFQQPWLPFLWKGNRRWMAHGWTRLSLNTWRGRRNWMECGWLRARIQVEFFFFFLRFQMCLTWCIIYNLVFFFY